jgi:hypothetical protein
MTTNTDRQTAEIIAFPARGRFAVAADRRDASKLALNSAPASAATKVAVCSGWYHEAAIQDERARRH